MPRLLILKFGAIGDVVMAIPAAHAMYQRGYTIDWVCGEAASPVLAIYPWINVIPIDDAKLQRSGKLKSVRATLSLWRRVAGQSYDIIATFYYDSRYKLLTLPLRARRKVLLSRTDRNTKLITGRHHTDEYARILVDQIGDLSKIKSRQKFGNDETPYQLAPIPAPTLPGNPLPRTSKTRIVIVPAGARNLMRDDALRRWPIENYVTLASALLARGYEVVLSGGPGDTWATPYFANLPVTDAIAKFTLLETLAVLDSADVMVTHDTGPLHLAGLTSCGIVTIFGPTDPRGRLPQRHNTVALWGGEGFACRPCYDGRNYAPCHNNGCIQQISPAMAFGEIETLLATMRDGKTQLPRVRAPKHTPVQLLTLP